MTGAPPAAASFADDFHRKHGRRPRILHIGNIANNAYINAKLLNEAGCDCDVACYDYYHIMGCPEWEDADFAGDVGDHFRPVWWKLDLHGFERPRWFAQGPQVLCLDYLIAKRDEQAEVAARLWAELGELNNTTPLRPVSTAGPLARVSHAVKVLRWKLSRVRGGADVMRSLWSRLDRWSRHSPARRLAGYLAAVVFLLLAPITLAPLLAVVWLRKLQRWWLGTARLGARHHEVIWTRLTGWASGRGVFRWAILVMVAPFAMVIGMLLSLLAAVALSRDFKNFGARAAKLTADFSREFPERADAMTIWDSLPFSEVISRWKALFAHYDIVIGYSTDGFLPLISNVPYFAFEHGTLREIPFRRTPEGRRTALAYRLAEHAFVTNFDCRENAAKLAPGRHTLINHPFDENHGLLVTGSDELRAALHAELQCEFLFFFPTRHDWVAGTGYADKSNDVFLRGLAQLRQAGLPVGAVCCEWGANVEQSKLLIDELGLTRSVKWITPLPTVSFERMARAAHCVVDQFVLGSFGGVMFKAMAVGAPVLTYLDEAQMAEQYPQAPPVINCRTTDQIVERMSVLLRRPEELAAVGQRARAWMLDHHSKRATVISQTRAFEHFLSRREAHS